MAFNYIHGPQDGLNFQGQDIAQNGNVLQALQAVNNSINTAIDEVQNGGDVQTQTATEITESVQNAQISIQELDAATQNNFSQTLAVLNEISRDSTFSLEALQEYTDELEPSLQTLTAEVQAQKTIIAAGSKKYYYLQNEAVQIVEALPVFFVGIFEKWHILNGTPPARITDINALKIYEADLLLNEITAAKFVFPKEDFDKTII